MVERKTRRKKKIKMRAAHLHQRLDRQQGILCIHEYGIQNTIWLKGMHRVRYICLLYPHVLYSVFCVYYTASCCLLCLVLVAIALLRSSSMDSLFFIFLLNLIFFSLFSLLLCFVFNSDSVYRCSNHFPLIEYFFSVFVYFHFFTSSSFFFLLYAKGHYCLSAFSFVFGHIRSFEHIFFSSSSSSCSTFMFLSSPLYFLCAFFF